MKRELTWTSRHGHTLCLILIGIVLFGCQVRSQVSAQGLTQIISADGTRKAYYAAGDEFLTTGLDLLDRYWSEVDRKGKHLLRGHLDNYLPIELKSLEHEPAAAMMRSFADYFFAARDANTGLIPFSYDSWLDESQRVSTKGKQPVGLIARGVEICKWFPDDLQLQRDCLALADDTVKHFDFDSTKDGQPELMTGFWGWVDVKTGGEPRVSLTLTQDFGAVANSMAYLSKQTGTSQHAQWADQKLEFVWQNRMNDNQPVLNDLFTPTKALVRPEEFSSDTDTLYYVRHLFDLYDLTGERKYRDWAIAVTDLWYENAWNQQWGHFIRKLKPDGTPAVNTLYGDGKYNTLHILIHAYQVTHDAKYIERFKLAWNNLLRMGQDGLAPKYVKQGKMVAKYGLDKQQSIFLEILVAAYQASGDHEILKAAEDLGYRMIEKGESVMRIEGSQAGNAFLRLALARQKIRRLEVALGNSGLSLRVKQGTKQVFAAIVPAQVAVLYLPQGGYELVLVKDGISRTKNVVLDRNKREMF